MLACSSGCAEKPIERTVRKLVPEAAPAVPMAPVKEESLAPAPEVRQGEEPEKMPDGNFDVEESRQEVAKRIERFDRQMNGIRAKIATLEETARDEWNEKVAAWTASRDAVELQFTDAVKATGEASEGLWKRAHAAWDELEKGVAKAADEL